MCAEKKKTLLIECRCRFSESGMIEGKRDVIAKLWHAMLTLLWIQEIQSEFYLLF